MKAIKGILFVLTGLFVFITVLSLLMPSRVMMVRTQVIRAPQDSVFTQLKDLRNWTRWHPVFQQKDIKQVYGNVSSGKGAEVRWQSNSLENTLHITEDSAYTVQATLDRPGEPTTVYLIRVIPMNNPSEVEVEWKSVLHLKWYPWEKFSGMLIDKVTGPGYEEALRRLRDLCEQ